MLRASTGLARPRDSDAAGSARPRRVDSGIIWNSREFTTLIQSGRWAPPESGQATSAILESQARLARSVFGFIQRLDIAARVPLDYVVCRTQVVPVRRTITQYLRERAHMAIPATQIRRG